MTILLVSDKLVLLSFPFLVLLRRHIVQILRIILRLFPGNTLPLSFQLVAFPQRILCPFAHITSHTHFSLRSSVP